MRTRTFVALTALLALAGCAASTSHERTAVTSSSVPPPPRPWAQMDHAARGAHMSSAVLPASRALFLAWRPERYAEFSCATCHGEDAGSRGFAMPNPSLIALYPTGTIGQEETLAQYLDASTFMYSRLLPAVQTMVGAHEYDVATQTGFSCFSCHPHAAEDDPRNRPAHP